MNMQPILQPRTSANGYPHRRVEREGGMNKAQPVKSHFVKIPNAVSGETAHMENPSRDRLVYLTTCLVGHPVEVQLKNGSLYSGIFHAADVEKNYGVVLKMACLVKEGASQGQKTHSEFVGKPPSKTLIIPADELVQVVAQDVAITRDGLSNAFHGEMPPELLTDSSISQSSRVIVGRELKPWVPDGDIPECPELENVFDGPWNRGWDQFEVNQTLFGVKSTFNEELYTTKLERSSRTRELEEQAMRIAREIEGESTRDIHVAEERGLKLNDKFDTDEEAKYSSVHRVDGFDDSGYEDEEDILLNSHNNLTFGVISASDGNKLPSSCGKGHAEARDGGLSTWGQSSMDQSCSISEEHEDGLTEKHSSEQRNISGVEVTEAAEKQSSSGGRQAGPTGSASASPATSRPGLSPASSLGSSSSEKSKLNPNAKEFKLNPNAKSFKPSQPAVMRPPSPIADGPPPPFYYPAQMPGLPLGYGMGAAYPGHHQPVVYTPQLPPMQGPDTYFPPNGPPHQMMGGQARPVMYMSPYQQEMAYNKGRDY